MNANILLLTKLKKKLFAKFFKSYLYYITIIIPNYYYYNYYFNFKFCHLKFYIFS